MTEEAPAVTWINQLAVIDGKKWIAGYGVLPADYMFIGDRPGDHEVANNSVFSGPAGDVMWRELNAAGFDHSRSYFTNAVKYKPPNNAAVNAGDIKACKSLLEEEYRRAGSKVIVCLGATALKAICGNTYGFAEYRGTFMEHPKIPGVQVFAMYNPAYVIRNPEAIDVFRRDVVKLAQAQKGVVEVFDKTDYTVIQTVAQLTIFKDMLFSNPSRILLCLDAEWDGITWMDPKKYIRTVQLGYALGKAVVIEFTDVGGKQVMDAPDVAWELLKLILEDPRVCILGQNVISDGQWLLTYGIDIRPRVIYDTMLAEHVINETGPFGLEELTVKYTKLGRYDIPVMRWREEHPELCTTGFGNIPRDILIPYGATDVDAPMRIMVAQAEMLEPFRKPRGGYPSLWNIVMETQRTLYEIEINGMGVDPARLRLLIDAYAERLEFIENQLKVMAATLGMPDFNHRSVNQVRSILFEQAKLTPIKTTKNKKWNTTQDQAAVVNKFNKASTDKNTLEILQDKHPIVKSILNVRRLDTVVKYFLRDDDEDTDEATKGGGIASKVWPDGRLHPHFSQLSETGRFRTSKPNCQNWPKKAEGFMADIFGGKDKVPPLIRTIVVPKPGYVLMEGDFQQAELFVLAALSGDKGMMDALTTPGKDLHDLTAISSFRLQVLGPDGIPIPEQHLLDLARTNKKEFEELQGKLLYLTEQGKRLTRTEFKNGLRVSAKNVNFG